MKTTCIGILGKLFGHTFEAAYDVDKENMSEEEIQDFIHDFNRNNLWTSFDITMKPELYAVKRETKVYRGHVCKRCGHTVNNEGLKL